MSWIVTLQWNQASSSLPPSIQYCQSYSKHLVVDTPFNLFFLYTLFMLFLLVWCISSKDKFTTGSSTPVHNCIHNPMNPCLYLLDFFVTCQNTGTLFICTNMQYLHMQCMHICRPWLPFDRCVYVLALGKFFSSFHKEKVHSDH